MVTLFTASSTFTCALNEGELDNGRKGVRKLTPEQCILLDQQTDFVDGFLYA
jgi:hypothetical protein